MTLTTPIVALAISMLWLVSGHGPLVWLAATVRWLRMVNRALRLWALDSWHSWPHYWRRAGREL